jgi:hypothetical protein
VFCVGEKTAIQALDRLDPVLPLSPGRAERYRFEYYRHGTLSLYAALNTATGRVHGKTAARHTSREFVAFLQEVVSLVPASATERSRQLHEAVAFVALRTSKVPAWIAFLSHTTTTCFGVRVSSIAFSRRWRFFMGNRLLLA